MRIKGKKLKKDSGRNRKLTPKKNKPSKVQLIWCRFVEINWRVEEKPEKIPSPNNIPQKILRLPGKSKINLQWRIPWNVRYFKQIQHPQKIKWRSHQIAISSWTPPLDSQKIDYEFWKEIQPINSNPQQWTQRHVSEDWGQNQREKLGSVGGVAK